MSVDGSPSQSGQGTGGRWAMQESLVKRRLEAEEAFEKKVGVVRDEEGLKCMHMFDRLAGCYNLPQQFKNVYRYGSYKDCRPHFAEWRFCLGLKVKNEDDAKEAMRRHRVERTVHRVVERSSENVWEARTEPLRNYPNMSGVGAGD